MAKIMGGTTATPMRVPDWEQTNPLRADYIKNKPNMADYATTEYVDNALANLPSGGEKVYEHIATMTVVDDGVGPMPQHVIFSTDSAGQPFELTDFIVYCRAGFVDGGKSTLYIDITPVGESKSVNVMQNIAVGSMSSSLRNFNVYFTKYDNGYHDIKVTDSVGADSKFNSGATTSRILTIPPNVLSGEPISAVDLWTWTGTNMAWVEGSTFELWGVRK